MGRVLIEGRSRPVTSAIVGLDTAGGALDRASVRYAARPHGDQRCADCNHFMANTHDGMRCSIVEGRIAAHGWCAMWAPVTARTAQSQTVAAAAMQAG